MEYYSIPAQKKKDTVFMPRPRRQGLCKVSVMTKNITWKTVTVLQQTKQYKRTEMWGRTWTSHEYYINIFIDSLQKKWSVKIIWS